MAAFIYDFARKYAAEGVSRFHMPAHKGVPLHGLEPLDLTEIKGADSLYECCGIIADSERTAAEIFGAGLTCYSAEGSSLSIKAALEILRRRFGSDVTIAAARNCHRAFLNGCALLGIDVEWIYPDQPTALLCSCSVTPQSAAAALERSGAAALYITSPDYLGSMADVASIAKVCHEHGALLICDNAHGAYLKFLPRSLHPIDLGADIVCDSAHKTLPVYTGGAYLHISRRLPELFSLAKPAMALFGSTSPSYLIMESLDLCNDLLCGELPEMIRSCCRRTASVKARLAQKGICDLAAEPLKITICCENLPTDGLQTAEAMREFAIECEYADPCAVTLMTSPYNSEEDFQRLERFIDTLTPESAADRNGGQAPLLPRCEKVLDLRTAYFSPSRRVPVEQSLGLVCARPAMSCQPSVAAVMAGEKISAEAINFLKRYGIFEVDVL